MCLSVVFRCSGKLGRRAAGGIIGSGEAQRFRCRGSELADEAVPRIIRITTRTIIRAVKILGIIITASATLRTQYEVMCFVYGLNLMYRSGVSYLPVNG